MSVIMALKRKRSFDELPSSPLSLASPPLPLLPGNGKSDGGGGGGGPVFTFPADQAASFARDARLANPCHLHSRTLKRFRDNRPSEEEIHQRTLQLLYTGQRRQQRQQQQDQADGQLPRQQQEQQQDDAATTTTSLDCSIGQGQQSLHRFWGIPSGTSPQSAASSMTAEGAMHTTHHQP